MFKQALQKFIAWCWYYFFEYFRTFLFPQIKEAFFEAKDKFLESLWDRIKEDIHAQADQAVAHVKEYVASTDYEVREKAALDAIFKKINLPIVLKPFKPLIRHIFKQKIRALIEDSLRKLDTMV